MNQGNEFNEFLYESVVMSTMSDRSYVWNYFTLSDNGNTTKHKLCCKDMKHLG